MTAVRRGWFHLASGAGFGRIFGFVSNLLLSRWLGPADLGLFNLVTTTVQTSDTLVRCGGDYALNFELGGQTDATKSSYGAELAQALTQICSLATVLICLVIAAWVWTTNAAFPTLLVSSQRDSITVLLLLMILCECSCASAWEILLASHRTASLSLKQGLFLPLRLFSAACGSLYVGVLGAMCGWLIVCLLQFVWLKSTLGQLWRPLSILPILYRSVSRLLSRGFTFYVSNLLATLIFYPLLLKVAEGSGLADIGYLRVGQILQQLFAFLPTTIVPVLFLRLRGETTFVRQVTVIESPLRVIWLLLIEVLLLYCMLDSLLIGWLFGASFSSALLPTRLLLITALFESLSQLAVQPILAAGRTRIYSLSQIGAAFLSAFVGWLWIPSAGLAAYLFVRLLYAAIPLVGFAPILIKNMHEPQKLIPLVMASLVTLSVFLLQTFKLISLEWTFPFFACVFLMTLLFQRNDLFWLRQVIQASN